VCRWADFLDLFFFVAQSVNAILVYLNFSMAL
jgi:hypothetical protein